METHSNSSADKKCGTSHKCLDEQECKHYKSHLRDDDTYDDDKDDGDEPVIIRDVLLQGTEIGPWHNVCYNTIIRKCEADQIYATNAISMLSKCVCCERHQIDRPLKYIPRKPTNIMPSPCQPDRCDCQCRSLSRLICYELYHTINP